MKSNRAIDNQNGYKDQIEDIPNIRKHDINISLSKSKNLYQEEVHSKT
jgi:hypothetical protein